MSSSVMTARGGDLKDASLKVRTKVFNKRFTCRVCVWGGWVDGGEGVSSSKAKIAVHKSELLMLNIKLATTHAPHPCNPTLCQTDSTFFKD